MPLFWLCLAAITGIFTASFCQMPNLIWISAALICLVGSFLEFSHFRNRNHLLLSQPIFRIPFALILCAFFLGAHDFRVHYPSSPPAISYGIHPTHPHQ